MGFNTAIGDGHNLGWKQAWVVNRWAGDALLDTYATERQPVGLHNTLRSMGSTDRGSGDGLAEDLGIVYRPTAAPEAQGCRSDDTASAGELTSAALGARTPHVWLVVGGRRLSTLDLFAGRFTLLNGRAGRWTTWCDHSWPTVTLTCDHDFTDLDGKFNQRCGFEPDGAVLFRPDGHIAWRAKSLGADADAEFDDVISRCAGVRTGTPPTAAITATIPRPTDARVPR